MAWRLMVVTALVSAAAFALPAQAQQPEQARASLGILVNEPQGNAPNAGVGVRAVSPDGPAAKAGIKRGDVIEKLARTSIKNYEDLARALTGFKPGQKVEVTVRHQGKDKTVTVTLGERGGLAAREPAGVPPGFPQPRGARQQQAYLGVEAEPLTSQLAQEMGIKAEHGALVRVVIPNSPAAHADIRQGDLITKVNNKRVDDLSQLREAVEAADIGKAIKVTVWRDGKSHDLEVKLQAAPRNFSGGPFPGFPGTPFGNGEGGFGNFPPGFGGMPPFGQPGGRSAAARIQELERRVQELERRLNDLEKREGNPPRNPAR